MKKRILLIGFFIAISSLLYGQDAIYKIEFISNWSSTTHPNNYPSGAAHWSRLIGTTHTEVGSFLGLGKIATDGVEEVAETGGTTTITSEINSLISAGTAYEIINGSGLNSGPGTITINDVNVDLDFPNITLLTMIAPSPDWIAMVANLRLTDTNDNWLSSVSIDVHATDAGTDNGTSYTSTNSDTNPKGSIKSLQNTTPFSEQIIGTFTFTLQQVLSVSNNNQLHSITIYPNPTNSTLSIKNIGTINLESVELFTVNGRKIKEYNKLNNQSELALENLPTGLYFLQLNALEGSITKKIVIK